MNVKRNNYSGKEKLRVAAEALCGHVTQNEITRKYGIHSSQINRWKNQLKTKAEEIFASPHKKSAQELETSRLLNELYKKVGQLEMERDWLKKKSELFS